MQSTGQSECGQARSRESAQSASHSGWEIPALRGFASETLVSESIDRDPQTAAYDSAKNQPRAAPATHSTLRDTIEAF